MGKKILILNGHPYKKSTSARLAEAYFVGAQKSGFEVKLVNVRELKFDPVLWGGYHERILFEKDLEEQQELIKWCDHLVIVTPLWWSGLPALMKGYIDRVFLPQFAFRMRSSGIPDRLLKGRSARVIYTQGAPKILSHFSFERAFWISLKIGILQFCGFGPVKRTVFGSADKVNEGTKKRWVRKVEKLGGEVK